MLFLVLILSVYEINGQVMVNKQCFNETTLTFRYMESDRTETITCPRATPYCDPETKTCVSRRPLAEFKCPDPNGFYPAVRGCSGFTICQHNLPYHFTCSPGHYYSPNLKECSPRGILKKACPRFQCRGKHGISVAHDVDKSLYAFCMNGEAVTMNSCPVGWYFDSASQKCVFVCKGDGRILEPMGNQMVFYCTAVRNGYKKEQYACPEGFSFDMARDVCVEDKQ